MGLTALRLGPGPDGLNRVLQSRVRVGLRQPELPLRRRMILLKPGIEAWSWRYLQTDTMVRKYDRGWLYYLRMREIGRSQDLPRLDEVAAIRHRDLLGYPVDFAVVEPAFLVARPAIRRLTDEEVAELVSHCDRVGKRWLVEDQ